MIRHLFAKVPIQKETQTVHKGNIGVKKDRMVEAVYCQYYKIVFRFCMRLTNGNQHDAEDITSEVFHVFFAEQDTLCFDAKPAMVTWLYRTAKNKWMNTVKHSKRRNDELDDTDIFSRQFDGEEEEKLYQTYLAEIEKTLSGSELDLFRAIVREKQTYMAISERMGISEAALRVRWHRLKHKIRPHIDKIIYKL